MSERPITDGVPPEFVRHVNAYFERRMPPDQRTFLRAVLANNFLDAMAYAPRECTTEQLRAIARFVMNRVPGHARGSDIAVSMWTTGQTPAEGSSR